MKAQSCCCFNSSNPTDKRRDTELTSGLLAYEDLIPSGTTVALSDKDVLELMKHTDKTHFSPGTKFRYSNTGYTLLGQIVEKVSGLTFAEFLRRNIFQPLGMSHTLFYRVDDRSDRLRAYGYAKQDNAFVGRDQSLTSSVRADGSIYSSVEDLYKWDQALYGRRLVSRRTLRRAFTPGSSVDETTGYGFGWFIEDKRGLRMIWHSGNTVGFTAGIQRFPAQKFSVIILANRMSAQLGPIFDGIEEMLLFSRPRPVGSRQKAVSSRQKAVGRKREAGGGRREQQQTVVSGKR